MRGWPGAVILGVSDTERYIAWNRSIGGHLLLRHGLFGSRLRAHLLPDAVPFAFRRPAPMPHFLRGTLPVREARTTLLYSELVAAHCRFDSGLCAACHPHPGAAMTEHQQVRRADYRPPAFLIDTVALDFDLDPTATTVRSRLAVRRNPAHGNTPPRHCISMARR